MNKGELVDAVAAKTGATKSDTLGVLDAIQEVLCDELRAGNTVAWGGVAKFEVKVTPAQDRYVPSEGVKRAFPARKGVKVKAEKKLRDAAAASG